MCKKKKYSVVSVELNTDSVKEMVDQGLQKENTALKRENRRLKSTVAQLKRGLRNQEEVHKRACAIVNAVREAGHFFEKY